MERLKRWMQRMMMGRNGADQLSRTLVWFGLALLVLSSVLSVSILYMLSLVIYGVAVFRMFSRNTEKRVEENRRYLEWTDKFRDGAAHGKKRFQNRKQYTYFKCPNCKAWLRLPRGAGKGTVTCGKCGNRFPHTAR